MSGSVSVMRLLLVLAFTLVLSSWKTSHCFMNRIRVPVHSRLLRLAAVRQRTASTLVIVESPAKAKTIQKFLDEEEKGKYLVDYSAGHIREFSGAALGDALVHPGLGLRLSDLGIDVFDRFKASYSLLESKKAVVDRLRSKSSQVSRIVLASDEDREGEAIAWHLVQELKPTIPFERVVFHEITKNAISAAFAHPRPIDEDLVNAQEARSILDKLAGFTLSPLLWRFVAPALSAGRVQSCGLQLIAEKEAGRAGFVPSQFHSLQAQLTAAQGQQGQGQVLTARLQGLDGLKVANEKDFDSSSGCIRDSLADKVCVLDKELCLRAMHWLSTDSVCFRVTAKSKRELSRSPPLPFITSSLQQEGSSKLGYSPWLTMSIAQGLYERGYITYMRTDSPVLSQVAKDASTAMIKQMYGEAYLHDGKKDEKTSKAPKNAQEAHEAIRPAEAAGVFRAPSALADELTADELRLYSLIFSRTLASLMPPSQSLSVSLTVLAKDSNSSNDDDGWTEASFKASETTIVFPGHLAALHDTMPSNGKQPNFLDSLSIGQDLQLARQAAAASWTSVVNASEPVDHLAAGEAEPDVEAEEASNPLAALEMPGLRSVGHDTRPPGRFTEASFIRELERVGVGRPSTYSYILQILKLREYILVDKQTVIPTVKGLMVAAFLSQHFSAFINQTFTARMEELLDHVAKGDVDKVSFLRSFYFGSEAAQSMGLDGKGLLPAVAQLMDDATIDRRLTRELALPCLKDIGALKLSPNGVQFKKNGSLALESTWKLPIAMEKDIREITREKVLQIINNEPPLNGNVLGTHPVTQEVILFRFGKFGKYLELAAPPVTGGSRVKTSNLRTISVPGWFSEDMPLEDILELVSFPKTLGLHPTSGSPVTLEMMTGWLSVVVRSNDSIVHVDINEPVSLTQFTLNDALDRLKKAEDDSSLKTVAPSDLRSLGDWNGTVVSIKNGRFGLYLQAGKVYAGLSKKDPKTITLAEAIELLGARIKRDIAKKVSSERKIAAGKPVKSPKTSSADDALVVEAEQVKSKKPRASKPADLVTNDATPKVKSSAKLKTAEVEKVSAATVKGKTKTSVKVKVKVVEPPTPPATAAASGSRAV